MGILLLALTMMWIREYRICREEEACLREKRPSPRKRSIGFGLTNFMLFAGPPQFIDPFGNAYYFVTRSPSVFSASLPPGTPRPKFTAFVCTANRDRSIGRTLAYDPVSGFTY